MNQPAYFSNDTFRRAPWILRASVAALALGLVLLFGVAKPPAIHAQGVGGTITHTSAADFGAACATLTNTSVSSASGGEIRLRATVEDYFDNTTIDATRWITGISNPAAGNTNLPVVSAGLLTLDGNYLLSQAVITQLPRVYEARARLMQSSNTSGRPDLGFYRDQPPLYNPDFANTAIRLFVTGDTDANNLIVRARNASDPMLDIDIPDPDKTQFHTWRVEWEPAQTRFYIDDLIQATMITNTPVITSYVILYHQDPGIYGTTPMEVDWVRAGQYASSGSYVSCALDAGQPVYWTTFSPTTNAPTGTAIAFRTRTSLDGANWSAWSAPSGTAITSPAGRYLQYALDLSTTDAMRSPEAQQVSVSYQPFNSGASLRFYGHGVNDIDRVKIQVDDPTNNDSGPPADVGATDFTVEFWTKASASENLAPTVSCGANNNWINGNIIVDRDRYNQDRKYGISVAGGKIVLGVGGDGTGNFSLCGATNVLDTQWHHIAIQRRRVDGWLWIYVDGNLDAQADGPDGDISYPDNGVPGNLCGATRNQPCTNSDPYLVIGAEKHDVGPAFPSFSGWFDEMRVSTNLRYAANFTRPSTAFTPDASTAALYHLDEGPLGACTGAVSDALGASNGACMYGGVSPAGPVYTTDTPFNTSPPTTTPTPTNTPVVPTNTPTNTPGAPTNTPTNTPAVPTNTPTSTPAAGNNFALSFDGTNDLAVAGQAIGTGPLTIEAWVRPTSNNVNAILVANADNNTGWSLEIDTGRATLWLSTNLGWRSAQHSTALVAGQWYHIAATYSAGSARVFVNGNASTAASVGTLTQGPALRFGGMTGYPFFNGALDEVRFSNLARYTATFTAPTAPFAPDANTLGLWHFNEGAGQSATDVSASANNATLGATSASGADDPVWIAGYPFASGTPAPTATNTLAPPTNTPTLTNTPLPPTNTPTRTNTPLPATATPTPTNTSAVPTNTPTLTNTPVPPTATPTRTNTPVPPTATRTNTPLPPTATRTNTPVPPTATPTNTPIPGSNFGLQFDGANDLAVAGQVVGTGPLTVEAWVRPGVNNATGLLVIGADANTGWSLEIDAGRATFWLSTNLGWRSAQHSTALVAGQWYHVAATYSAGSARVFVNGNASTTASVGTLTQGPWLRFGGLAGFPFYNGALDEVRVSNLARYSANFTPPASLTLDANTIGLWRFNENAGQIAADASPSANNATLGTTSGAETSDPVWITVTR